MNMSFFKAWLFALEEAIINVIEYGLERQTVENLFDILGYNGVYNSSYTSMSAEKIIYSFGNSDENYSSEEIDYMNYSQFAKEIFSLKSTNINEAYEKISFYYFEINALEIEKDLIACAIIKLFNKAFKGPNCYLIRNNNSICFGAKYIENEIDDFIISRWFDKGEDNEVIAQFAFENIESDSLYKTYIFFLETVIANSHLIKKETFSDYNQIRMKDYDLINALREIGGLYNINCNRTINIYEKYFMERRKEVEFDRYNQIVKELRFIGSNLISSYDMLEIAATSEKEAEKLNLFNQNSPEQYLYEEDEIDKKVQSLDDEVFNDAEKILEYIIKWD